MHATLDARKTTMPPSAGYQFPGSSISLSPSSARTVDSRIGGFSRNTWKSSATDRDFVAILRTLNPRYSLGRPEKTRIVPMFGVQPDPIGGFREGFGHELHRHRVFINGLSEATEEEAMITREVAERALNLWWQLYKSTDYKIAIPDAAAGPNGELIQIWKKNGHYLSLETSDETDGYFFYQNPESHAVWDCEWKKETPLIDDALLDKLNFFAR